MNVSARWRKYVKDPCQIYVYGNGDLQAPALRLLLIPRVMKTWDLVLGEITEKISLRTGQAVRKLYDINFKLLEDPGELVNGSYYIAVGTERLKKFPYGELTALNASHHSPRRNHTLPPLRKAYKPRPPANSEGEQTYTKMYAHRKQAKEQEETTVMGASAVTGYRPLRTKKYKPQRPPGAPPTHEGESVFHAKPVKVKRSGVRAATESHPPTGESDSVFHAQNRDLKAEEVGEDEDTKVDLPIDQVPADAVDEEELQTSARPDEDNNSIKEDVPEDVSFRSREADDQVEEEIRAAEKEEERKGEETPTPSAAPPVVVPRTPQEREMSPDRSQEPSDRNEQPKNDEDETAHPPSSYDETPVLVTSLNDDVEQNPPNREEEHDRSSRISSPTAPSTTPPSNITKQDEIEEQNELKESNENTQREENPVVPEENPDASQKISQPQDDEEDADPEENVTAREDEDKKSSPDEELTRVQDENEKNETQPEEDDRRSVDDEVADKDEAERSASRQDEAVDRNSPSPGPTFVNPPEVEESKKEEVADDAQSTDDEKVKEELDVSRTEESSSELPDTNAQEANVLTPSSPLPDDDRSRSAADGENMEENEDEDKVKNKDDGEKESEQARPDSNVTGGEGEPPVTASGNNSLPNGTANGIQEVQP